MKPIFEDKINSEPTLEEINIEGNITVAIYAKVLGYMSTQFRSV